VEKIEETKPCYVFVVKHLLKFGFLSEEKHMDKTLINVIITLFKWSREIWFLVEK